MASPAISNLLLLFLLPFLPVFAASNITLNSSLSATGGDDSWISPSGEFAFGFCQINNTNTILLAIWYAKIPEKTVVWHANTSSPVQTGSKVELTPDGLALNDPSGRTIWKAQPNTTVSYGAMLDTGNFVLSGTNNSSYVWESFDYPTDTILPIQVLSLGGMLYSRLSETNYSKGRFELHFTNGGDLELDPIAWPSEIQYGSYYTSATANPNASQSGFQLVFSQSADINIVKGNGATVPLSWQSITTNFNHYHRATLDSDGVFRQYTCPKTSIGDQSWSVVRYIPNNICLALTNEIGSGVCGFNSYCVANNGNPDCQCPPGYSFFDPNNKFRGCKPNFPQGCGVDDGTRNPNELYELVEIDGLNFPFGDYDSLGPYNQTQCEQSCLHDCSCVVAIFSGTRCWKKRLPLSNGRLEGGLAIIKVMKGSVTPSGSSHYPLSNSKKDNQILLWSLFGSSGFFNILLLILISLMVFSRHQKKSKTFVHDSSVPETNLHIFTFQELKVATEGFKEELGRGSFGIVYKGVLKFGSKKQIAVKKLDKLSQGGEREFKAEVSAIGKTHHKNLVQLLGYCYEGPHRLLVYEFMSNGSLANFLFDLSRPNWYQRTQVALGIARGLVYLHEECSTPIIHCDIKPQNILIDEYFTARISDFGLAKSLMFNQTQTHTGIRGTRGYVAPEWFKNVPVTVKVDVYSFGVMLLEIICCRKSVALELEEEGAILTDWAYDCYTEGRLDTLVDNDEAAMKDIATLQRWVMTAIWCIQEDPSKRPTMKMVMQMLEGYVEVPVPIPIPI
ncbi:G-type lectin S-receptor-like serine/threonine-protein kinase LECRK3 [Actinidia eriantha]|uniref:G-type lectin S-receptor-like serine/threonine-protein kinase LECRK3 n=1 Tax=Actinidia eriantha TaxID=165200 RepID=UPI002590E23A|nr:G-type lectin S-receptor-like serine/threonine-protein kinase LECRK3 [Actinidia eriantha]